MRTELLSLLALFGTSYDGRADVEGKEMVTPITREEAATMKSYDLDKVEKIGPTLDGMTVRLRFSYRDKSFQELPDGGISGRLGMWQSYAFSAAPKTGTVAVVIPKVAKDWFLRLTSEFTKRGSSIVIARMSKADGEVKAELLGREIKTDSHGSFIVW